MAGHKFQVISVVLASAAVGIGLGVKDSLMRSTEIAPNSQVAKDVPVAPSLADNEDYLKEAVSCSDGRGSTSCNRWKWHCTNGGWQSWMKTNCEKTCGHCSEAAAPAPSGDARIKLKFGGKKSTSFDSGASGNWEIKRRPQFAKSMKCTGTSSDTAPATGCTPCGFKAYDEGCFGYDKDNYGGDDGLVRVKQSNFESGKNTAVLEVFVDCLEGQAEKWIVTVHSQGSGDTTRVFTAQGFEDYTFQDKAQGNQKVIELDINSPTHLRLEFTGTYKSTVDIQALLYSQAALAKTEDCMGAKMCLTVLAGGEVESNPNPRKYSRNSGGKGGQGIKLRNDNALQKRCLENFDTAGHGYLGAYEALDDICTEWATCLTDAGSFDFLKAMLQAFNPQPSLAQVQTITEVHSDSGDAPGCINPASDDPESWECDCEESLKEACGSAPTSTCIKEQMCNFVSVCTSWKTANNCGGVLEDDQLSQAAQENISEASLEESLTGKRSC